MPGFSGITGHERIIEYFRHSIENHKISHSYILSGEDGVGKMMVARAFAQALLCENYDGDSCGKCHSCVRFESDNHPDVIYLKHEKSSIGVDDVRAALVGDIQIKPYDGKYKIYIIDEAELMTPAAQNAILKTIEEPPSYAVIILLTNNEDIFLPTILSRCITLKLRPLDDRLVKEALQGRYGLSEYDADIFASFARGSIGQALKLSKSEGFAQMISRVLQVLKHIYEMDISELLKFINELKDSGIDLISALEFMQIWYRDVLLFKATKDTSMFIFKDEYRYIMNTANTVSFGGLDNILKAIEKAKTRLNANVNPELAMELMFITIIESREES
ncbi:MAG: DNA polymerase III subunit delta' [Lachnospiraceae bacterium]|nr:DNA polymerase III subunit delta' [Lachnospiraceae bacterium]